MLSLWDEVCKSFLQLMDQLDGSLVWDIAATAAMALVRLRNMRVAKLAAFNWDGSCLMMIYVLRSVASLPNREGTRIELFRHICFLNVLSPHSRQFVWRSFGQRKANGLLHFECSFGVSLWTCCLRMSVKQGNLSEALIWSMNPVPGFHVAIWISMLSARHWWKVTRLYCFPVPDVDLWLVPLDACML